MHPACLTLFTPEPSPGAPLAVEIPRTSPPAGLPPDRRIPPGRSAPVLLGLAVQVAIDAAGWVLLLGGSLLFVGLLARLTPWLTAGAGPVG